MQPKHDILKIFAVNIRKLLSDAVDNFEKLQEIRLRTGRPLLISLDGKEYFIASSGVLSRNVKAAYIVSKQEIAETMEYISNYSLYAFEEEVKQGFITIQGGHRVGLAGKAVLQGERIGSIKYISYINVRMSHQIKGCSDTVMPYLYQDGFVCHTLIISPPRCGKTTLLRDIIRRISDGWSDNPGCTVGVVDERSELAGAYMGVAQNDIGTRTDVLDCCPKAEGMMMLIRSMSPSVICVDEIGDDRDMQAIESVIHCGCKLIATVHGNSLEDIRKKPLLQELVRNHVMERYIILQDRQVSAIFDQRGDYLFREEKMIC